MSCLWFFHNIVIAFLFLKKPLFSKKNHICYIVDNMYYILIYVTHKWILV